MRFASTAIASCLLLLSGCSTSHPTGPEKIAVQAAATQQDREASPTFVLRLTHDWHRILSDQWAYLANEGPTHRGPLFADLAISLYPSIREGNVTRPPKEGEQNPNPISELEVLMLLGQPDKYYSDERGVEMFYRYKSPKPTIRFGARESEDWAAVFYVNANGILTSIGFNEASILMPPGPGHAAATTQPATPSDGAGNGFLGVALVPETWEKGGQVYEGTFPKIGQVLTGSPADRAGLHVGDVITELNSVFVGLDLAHVVRQYRPGEAVTLTVHPSGKTSPTDFREVRVTVGHRPSPTTQP
jgi:hypothetical protein